MECQPLISVVVTCYNYGRYLKGCLDSILAQTYNNIEIVIVDDGSTDNTVDVMKSFRELPNLKYIRQNNAGQAHAKNVGINNSSGDFVAFLDADDLWCPDKLEKQIICFNNQVTGVVYCRASYIDENDEILDHEMTGPYLQPKHGIVTKWLLFDNFVQFSSSVIRKECLERFGGFDESLKMGIDWDLWLRISTYYEFDYVDERLFYYRMGHSGQMSKNITERHRCSDRIMTKFISTFPDAVSNTSLIRIMAYTYCNRGAEIWDIDKKQSYLMYFKAIAQYPFWTPAYKGILKNVFSNNSK